MGAASAASQSSAMPQPSQGKGGSTTMGNGSPATNSIGKVAGSAFNVVNKNLQNNATNSIEDTYRQQLGREGETAGLDYWKGQFGDSVDANELKTFQAAAAPELAGRSANTQPLGQGTGKGGATQDSSQNGPQLPNAGQQGWQYGQGASGDRVTYPSTSGQQQFGQPMQSTQNPYSNTIGQGQQSNQMGSSGKGKGA